MMNNGGCHCGEVRYEADGDAVHHTVCHCTDCRRNAGAPIVAWIAFPTDALRVTKGETAVYASSASARRHFCIQCGTGLFYTNAEMLPGIVDIQSSTLDDPENHVPGAQIQVAERLPWVADLATIHEFSRYPGMQ